MDAKNICSFYNLLIVCSSLGKLENFKQDIFGDVNIEEHYTCAVGANSVQHISMQWYKVIPVHF